MDAQPSADIWPGSSLQALSGSAEGVLSAAGLGCFGEGMRAKIRLRDEEERRSLIDARRGDRFNKRFSSKALACGHNFVFAATGICSGPFFRGAEVRRTIASPSSLLMRALHTPLPKSA